MMKISRSMSVLAFVIASTLMAEDAQVTPLISKDLAELPGKEGLTKRGREIPLTPPEFL